MRNPSLSSACVIVGIQRKLRALPHTLRGPITDRGTEFAAYLVLKPRLGLDSYSARPKRPGKAATLTIQWPPAARILRRETDVALLSDDELDGIGSITHPANASTARRTRCSQPNWIFRRVAPIQSWVALRIEATTFRVSVTRPPSL